MNHLENKYSKIYFAIIEDAKQNTPSGYCENHHIIPKSLGGKDSPDNMVKLSARQHFLCHLLLTKMFPTNSYEFRKSFHAFGMMLWCESEEQQRYYKLNSKIYQKVKEEFSVCMSEHMKTEVNSSFGTMWIYNDKLEKSKKIPKTDGVPKEWELGRVVNWDNYWKRQKKKKPFKKYCKICTKSFLSNKTNAKYCSSKCKKVATKLAVRKYRINHPKPKNEVKFYTKNCETCKLHFETKTISQKFCSLSCRNKYKHKSAKRNIKIVKGSKEKYVKRNDVPSYEKCGWKMISSANHS